MKSLNYSYDYLMNKENKKYKDILASVAEVTEEYSMSQTFPFGKYRGMLLYDLAEYDFGYFIYMKNMLLEDTVSENIYTYSQRIKLLKSMSMVERRYKIGRYEREYERRKTS